ncbi:MAG: c-type cytochrome [Gammaproteobacteria bacterium]
MTASEAINRSWEAARPAGVAGHARLGAGWLAALLAMLVVGCGKEDGSSSGRGFLPPANYAADAQRGRQVFQANCAACHGADARGTDQGPGPMPPVKGVSPEQVADIIAWVRQRQRSAGIH